jgi:hypothetical protein
VKLKFLPFRAALPALRFRRGIAVVWAAALFVYSGLFSGQLAAAESLPGSPFRTWVGELKPGEWRELPGKISDVFVARSATQGGGEVIGAKAVIIAWNGAAWDGNCGYFLGGGHTDYGGNEVYRYCWEGQQSLKWSVLMPPSTSDPDDHSNCPHPLEGPRAYHTYNGLLYVPDTRSIFIWGSVGYCQEHMFGRDELPELMLGPAPSWKLNPPGPVGDFVQSAYNDRTGKVYLWEGNRQVYIFDPNTLSYQTSGNSTANYGANVNMIYDSKRNVLWVLTKLGLFQFVLGPDGQVVAFKRMLAPDRLPAGTAGSDGIALRKGKLYVWSGNNAVSRFDPDTDSWTTYALAFGPTRASGNGIYSKWHYLDNYDVFVGVSHFDQGMWVWKPVDGAE